MKIDVKLIVFTLLLAAWTSCVAAAAAPETWPPLSSDPTAVIVLDPGHGGASDGVKGPDGALEKDLMLELARKIKARLVPDYEVRLTRDDDYQVSLADRAGLANASQAALMISLHTGAGFSPRPETTTIYLYRSPQPDALAGTDTGDAPPPEWQWRYQQTRHQEESRRLGDYIAGQFGALALAVVVETASLPVLAGADLPAVLLEFGDLNNAAGEERLTSAEWQQHTAGAIADAVRAFVSRRRH
jgi:N-acetylmuramoyl-L-alanine amidase